MLELDLGFQAFSPFQNFLFLCKVLEDKGLTLDFQAGREGHELDGNAGGERGVFHALLTYLNFTTSL